MIASLLARHGKLTLLASLALPVAMVCYWYHWDSQPPSILGPQTSIPSVHAGEELQLDMDNQRDLTRGCSMEISRDLVDSTKQRRTLFASQKVSAQGFRDRERLSPGRLKIVIPIPAGVPSGEAHILTNAIYRCPRNMAELFIPIEESYDWKFVVLPPEPKTVIIIPARP